MTETPESILVHRVKDTQDSGALTELINMHTGIYFTVVNNYAKAYPDVIKINDMQDDKMYYMYKFILDYKDDRNTKLSTYIGDRTDYLCKHILKRENRNPLCGGEPILGTPDEEHPIQVVDQTPSARPAEIANKEIVIDDVLRVASTDDVCPDKRFAQILAYRLRRNPMSWRKIGDEMKLSHEWARKIYVKNMGKVKRNLRDRV